MQVAPPPPPVHQQYSSYTMNPLPHHQSASQSALSSQQQQQHASSARKRKRAANSLVHYRLEQEADQLGRVREYIVIEDTPPPDAAGAALSHALPPGLAPTPSSTFTNGGVRTRAQLAAAASNSSLPPPSAAGAAAPTSAGVPPSKRRRKETFADNDTPGGTPNAQYLNLNGIPGPSSGAYARKAIAGRAYETQKQMVPTANGGWAPQGSNGTESMRASQTSQASTQQPSTPTFDDKEGYYIINPGEMVGTRYRIQKLLGQGTFGKVVEAVDILTKQKVAVKIIRAIPKYRDASKIEIRVLKTLKARDPTNINKCIHLLEWFDFRNHICIVTELLGLCIYDFLKENEFQPFPRRHIQDFARQLLQSVAFLHDLGLIHTDLKPENILLVDNAHRVLSLPQTRGASRGPKVKRILENTEVRLIDFGSATFEEEYHPTVVSTRHYRAPEIILGLGWTFPCDAFSIGCILVEFYTGVALFQTHDNLEHLAMMENVMGKMPSPLARRAYRTKAEFFKLPTTHATTPVLDYPRPKVTKQSRKDVKSTKPLGDVIKDFDIVNTRLLDLVRQLLIWEPNERITVRDALNHNFFDLVIPPEA